jgi:hypothetical protein
MVTLPVSGHFCGPWGSGELFFFGGVLFFAGLGLLKRNQLARRIQIVLAALVAVDMISSLFSSESGILEKSVPIVAIVFLILMFLPSAREQFARP